MSVADWLGAAGFLVVLLFGVLFIWALAASCEPTHGRKPCPDCGEEKDRILHINHTRFRSEGMFQWKCGNCHYAGPYAKGERECKQAWDEYVVVVKDKDQPS